MGPLPIPPRSVPRSDLDALRWRLVSTRDTSPAHIFVYAVKSTKIYCRPSCHSRLARRANVQFYDTAAEAAAAGFRPCKRCRPDDDTRQTDEPHKAAIEKALGILQREKGALALNDLAKEVGLSTRYFCGLFQKVTGTPPGAYAKKIRELHAQDSVSDCDCRLFQEAAEDNNNPIYGLDEFPELKSTHTAALDLFPALDKNDISWLITDTGDF